jgi:hypothetical protein
MKPIQCVSEFSREQLVSFINAVGPSVAIAYGLGNVDLDAGIGKINPSEVCLWDKEGRRITFEFGAGSIRVQVSYSDEIDPTGPGVIRRAVSAFTGLYPKD